MDRVIAKFLQEGVDLAQFERVRRQIRASDIYAFDNTQGRARDFGVGLSIGMSVDDVTGWIDALEAVTPEDVIAAGKRLLDRRDSVTGDLTQPQASEVNE